MTKVVKKLRALFTRTQRCAPAPVQARAQKLDVLVNQVLQSTRARNVQLANLDAMANAVAEQADVFNETSRQLRRDRAWERYRKMIALFVICLMISAQYWRAIVDLIIPIIQQLL